MIKCKLQTDKFAHSLNTKKKDKLLRNNKPKQLTHLCNVFALMLLTFSSSYFFQTFSSQLNKNLRNKTNYQNKQLFFFSFFLLQTKEERKREKSTQTKQTSVFFLFCLYFESSKKFAFANFNSSVAQQNKLSFYNFNFVVLFEFFV